MTTLKNISIKPDYQFKRQKEKIPTPVYVKVTSIIKVNIDGNHTVLSNEVKQINKPDLSGESHNRMTPDLVMKNVPRFHANGEFRAYSQVIDINKSLKELGVSLDDILSSTTRRGSAEYRIKIAYKHTKTMTPEPEDNSISVGHHAVGAY